MKTKFFFTLALCLSLCTVAFAQKGKGNKGEMRNRPAEERATAHTNHLEKRLGLSAEQKTQVYAINLEAAKKNDELRDKRSQAGADKKAISVERKANNENRTARIEALLTGDQKTKWEAIKAAAKARKEAKGKGKGKNKLAPAGEELEDDDDE